MAENRRFYYLKLKEGHFAGGKQFLTLQPAPLPLLPLALGGGLSNQQLNVGITISVVRSSVRNAVLLSWMNVWKCGCNMRNTSPFDRSGRDFLNALPLIAAVIYPLRSASSF